MNNNSKYCYKKKEKNYNSNWKCISKEIIEYKSKKILI